MQESANAIRQRAAGSAVDAEFLKDEENDKTEDAAQTGEAEKQYAQELSRELKV